MLSQRVHAANMAAGGARPMWLDALTSAVADEHRTLTYKGVAREYKARRDDHQTGHPFTRQRRDVGAILRTPTLVPC